MSGLLSVLPTVQTLSPRLIRILGCNPGHMTLQGTNTYLVGTGSKRLLVEAGERDNSAYITALLGVLQQQQAQLSDVVITHWHHDHIGGLCDVLAATNKNAVVHKFPRVDPPDESLPDWVQLRPLHHLQDIAVEGAVLRAHHTPGHTTDHVCLELLGEEGADAGILTGDCILGESTAVFEDLFDYMKSLNALLDACPDHTPLYPGHGPVISDGAGKISEYIKHRQARESQIYDTLVTMTDSTPEQLVKAVYTGIADQLLPAAENNLRLHLGKLVREGRVSERDDCYSAVRHAGNKL